MLIMATQFYSLSNKTVNTRENFWNVYCFVTNQMRDETTKDKKNTMLVQGKNTILHGLGSGNLNKGEALN